MTGALLEGSEELVRSALTFYEQQLKPVLEPDRIGEEVAVYLPEGDWEVASTSVEADARLRERHPDAEFVFMTVGQPVRPWPWLRDDVPFGKG
jgi:hypothetical protein